MKLVFFDYFTIVVYFIFMLLIGHLFRRHTRDTSDYFRGGGVMTWWLVGSSSFVQTVSAWSFVGLAGALYSRGTLLTAIYFCNIVGVIICMLFTAGRFRRLRVITWVEAMRERYGFKTEQFYAWVNLLNGFLIGGVSLYILSVFMASIFDIDVAVTVLVIGVVVTIMSVAGGSWAVTASDFVQSLVIMSVIVVVAVLTLRLPEVGGIGGLLEKTPETHFQWGFDVSDWVLGFWLTAVLVNAVMNMNSLSGGAARLIVVKDEKHAVKSLFIGMLGYLSLPSLIAIPVLASTFLFPDLESLYPQLNFPKEGAYAAVAMRVLPPGMMGLLACAMFAATMSSLDTALNRNAGIFVKNVYQRWMRPTCSEKEGIIVGKVFTAAFGVVMIIIGLKFADFKGLPILETMQLLQSLLSQPMLIPLVLALFIKRVPSWTAASTVVVGFVVAFLLIKVVPVVDLAERWFGPLREQDRFDASWMFANLGVTFVSLGWFFFTMLFYRPAKVSPERARHIERFFAKQSTPIDPQAEGLVENDKEQATKLGGLSFVYGLLIAIGALAPNAMEGRLTFLITGGVIALIGAVLLLYARKCKPPVLPMNEGSHAASTNENSCD